MAEWSNAPDSSRGLVALCGSRVFWSPNGVVKNVKAIYQDNIDGFILTVYLTGVIARIKFTVLRNYYPCLIIWLHGFENKLIRFDTSYLNQMTRLSKYYL